MSLPWPAAWAAGHEQVIEIRRRLRAGQTNRAVAADFNVNQSTISRIASAKRWALVS